MATTSARERIITEAARLFSARGFAATSIADIQTACGLTAGSGALYKHFASKRELFETVVRRHAEHSAAGLRAVVAGMPDAPVPALRYIADAVWAAMDGDRHQLRIVLRDLDGFPQLLDEVWSAVLRDLYDALASWIDAQCELGRAQVDDAAATAAVLLASLTYYPILDALIARAPGEVGRAAFLDAWVRHAAASLAIAEA